MRAQCTNTLLMVEPVSFGFNAETAVNNYFQKSDNSDAVAVQNKALNEFSNFVDTLTKKGVNVIKVQDTPAPHTPDSIFPNNWVTFHGSRVVTYPMFAVNRRLERRRDIISKVMEGREYDILDLSPYEDRGIMLEGTGSMVLDREHRIAFAAISERTDHHLLEHFCNEMGYKPVAFHAFQDKEGKFPIYHTNVMMSVCEKFAVLCKESILDKEELSEVMKNLEGKEIIDISVEQMNGFAGNVLQVTGREGSKLFIMSEQARKVMRREQLEVIEKYCEIVDVPVPTIERYGGGGVRCMMAEVFR